MSLALHYILDSIVGRRTEPEWARFANRGDVAAQVCMKEDEGLPSMDPTYDEFTAKLLEQDLSQWREAPSAADLGIEVTPSRDGLASKDGSVRGSVRGLDDAALSSSARGMEGFTMDDENPSIRSTGKPPTSSYDRLMKSMTLSGKGGAGASAKVRAREGICPSLPFSFPSLHDAPTCLHVRHVAHRSHARSRGLRQNERETPKHTNRYRNDTNSLGLRKQAHQQLSVSSPSETSRVSNACSTIWHCFCAVLCCGD